MGVKLVMWCCFCGGICGWQTHFGNTALICRWDSACRAQYTNLIKTSAWNPGIMFQRQCNVTLHQVLLYCNLYIRSHWCFSPDRLSLRADNNILGILKLLRDIRVNWKCELAELRGHLFARNREVTIFGGSFEGCND